ncbi:MAG TPA: hypothetical protein VFQ27_01750 [Xanthobacteraceae bacterium]|nr:hypothetical protein [Xanthobacteraceae bacterium]
MDGEARQTRPFAPTERQLNVLLTIGFLSVGYALYLRYLAIEYTPVGLACQAGLDTWLCATRKFVTLLFNHSFFGWLALGAALLQLLRPSIVLLAVGLAAGGFGIVLYNVGLSSLAAGLLILSLARARPAEA